MAANDTYHTKVYHELGGERLVANSGGTFAVESMGSLAVASGGQMTLESSLILGLAGTDTAPEPLLRMLVSEQLMDSLVPIALSLKLVNSNIPANIGTFIIYASATVISGSIWLGPVSAGRELYLGLFGDSTGTFGNAQTQVAVSTSGCIILGSVGNYISNFTMNTSGASDVLVQLIAPSDNVWAIISQRGDVNETDGD